MYLWLLKCRQQQQKYKKEPHNREVKQPSDETVVSSELLLNQHISCWLINIHLVITVMYSSVLRALTN